MKAMTSGRASQALAQQVEIFGGGKVSLNSLWRVAGSPSGHDPESWIRLAESLVDGYGIYRSKLGYATPESSEGQAVWTWEGDSKDPWHEGDLMSERFLALAYAAYLDEKVEAGSEFQGLLD